jgi:vacuolar-type H+-ATPase subunit I/STV1
VSAINTVLPFTSAIISLVFAFLLFRRYVVRRGLHLLLWGIGMILYGTGGFCEGYYGAFGWNPFIFRLWYLAGAILVAAWLGQGTVYLLAKRRWAHVLMAVLALGSLFAAFLVFTAELDPSLMTTSVHTGSELSGHAIVASGVRSLTPIFNLYGTVTLVGGALYSAWIFWRKRVLLHRTIGNILIAVGAILPAFGGTFSRMGLPGALYISELLGAILLFIGFLRATTPMKKDQTSPQVQVEPRGTV